MWVFNIYDLVIPDWGNNISASNSTLTKEDDKYILEINTKDIKKPTQEERQDFIKAQSLSVRAEQPLKLIIKYKGFENKDITKKTRLMFSEWQITDTGKHPNDKYSIFSR